MEAVVRTAQLHEERNEHEKVGHAGRTFLDLLSEETVVLMGMLADAGGGNLQLTRRLDSERVTSGSLALLVQQFVMRLEVLFVNGAVKKTGYTAHVLKVLETPKKSENTLRGQGGEASWWLAPAAVGCYCMQLLETIQFLGEIGAGSRRSFSSHTLKSCSHCQFSM